MNPQRWQQIQAVFNEVLERDGAERLTFLEQACRGDADLLAEVEALLAHDDRAQKRGFLEKKPARATAGTELDRNTSIGPYELLEEVGRGGWGVVYKAHQTSLDRLVAVKVILNDDFASQTDRDRFASEAKALARLDHPHIVHVFDFGEHRGKPFFSMEFVSGGSLAQKLSQAPLDERAAAVLLETLAQTLHRVHQAGIVHRDLKPSNVLLSTDGVVKVSDFGLSKSRTDDSKGTASGNIAGSPSYMAPEQARGDSKRIGPPSDVYALGAILYEALTGRPPFRAASAWETVGQVIHQEPVPPSRLQPGLGRDISTICLKCLEKDPTRRYPSAENLAEDLRRFLDGRPITARSVSGAERLYRWGRRNPRVAGLSAALVLALVGGLVVSTSQWLRAETNLTHANDRFRLALDAVNAFYTGASEDVILKEKSLEGLRTKLLRSPLEFYRKLLADLEANNGTDEQKRADLAEAYHSLGEINMELGSKDDALSAFEQAVAIRQRLVQADAANVHHQRALALSYSGLGRLQVLRGKPDQAIQYHQQALSILDEITRDHPADVRLKHDQARSFLNVGAARMASRSLNETLRSYQQAITILKPILAKQPEDIDALQVLAKCYFNVGLLQGMSGQLELALESYKLARDIIEHSPHKASSDDLLATLAASYNSTGIIFKDKSNLSDALQALEQARIYRTRLGRDHPTSTAYQHALADTLVNLGVVQAELEQGAQALGSYDEGHSILVNLLRGNPSDARSQESLAVCLTHLAALQRKRGEFDQALRSLDQARTLLEGLSPTGITQYNLACVLAQHASILALDQAKSIAEQERYADLAMIALRRSFASGYQKLEQTKRDWDLAPLRSRADFQALVYDPGFPADPFQGPTSSDRRHLGAGSDEPGLRSKVENASHSAPVGPPPNIP